MVARHQPRGRSPSLAALRRRESIRADLESAIERAIAALDALDGDPDLEDAGDDEDSHDAEDADFHTVGNYVSHHNQTRPGNIY